MNINIDKCKKPWNDLIITPEGYCINCHFQDTKHCIGNINEDNIQHIWNGKELKDNRKKMLNGKIPDICKTGIGKCEYLK